MSRAENIVYISACFSPPSPSCQAGEVRDANPKVERNEQSKIFRSYDVEICVL